MNSFDAARAWFGALVQGDGVEAWRRTDLAYRRLLATRWADNEGLALDDPRVEYLLHCIVEEGQDDESWRDFARSQRLGFLDALPDSAKRGEWSWVERPRLVAPDCEVVYLVDSGELSASRGSDAPVAMVSTVKFFMRVHGSEWLLLGLHELDFAEASD